MRLRPQRTLRSICIGQSSLEPFHSLKAKKNVEQKKQVSQRVKGSEGHGRNQRDLKERQQQNPLSMSPGFLGRDNVCINQLQHIRMIHQSMAGEFPFQLPNLIFHEEGDLLQRVDFLGRRVSHQINHGESSLPNLLQHHQSPLVQSDGPPEARLCGAHWLMRFGFVLRKVKGIPGKGGRRNGKQQQKTTKDDEIF